ncbi:MAG: hypothetical protein QW225_03580 [Candidatus Jordarchaeales archaeon]
MASRFTSLARYSWRGILEEGTRDIEVKPFFSDRASPPIASLN